MDSPEKAAPLTLRLYELRTAKGWSQAELGDRMGYSDATINRVEAGKQNWNHEFLRAAAYALDCSIQDLVPPAPNSIIALLNRLDPAQQGTVRAMVEGLVEAKRRSEK